MDGSLPMPPRITLRGYQEKAVQAIRDAFATVRRVLFVLPTGGGKTVTFAYIVHGAASKGRRVYIVAHRIEIIRQISLALARQNVPHGVIAPGHPKTADPVQVCMVQTLSKRFARLPAPDLLVIDEAHHVVSNTYLALTAAWNEAFHLGVTATPERLDGRGLGACFDQMVLGPSAKELIAAGSLADFTYLAPPSELDLSGVHTIAGDYNLEELAQAMEKSQIVGDAVEHYGRYLGGKPVIAFCVNVWHAEAVAARFNAAGWRSASIDGRMGGKQRQGILDALAAGELDVLTSCNLVSEGFDLPAVAGAILLRPTKSLALFLQQVGRALRPKEDGSKAIILDHVGNCLVHGLPDWDRQWSLKGRVVRPKAAPVSVCTLCFATLEAPVRKEDVEDCEGAYDPASGTTTPCPYLEEKKKPPRELEEVDGELVDAKATMPEPDISPERSGWAAGIDLERAKGRDWFRLLDLAGTDIARLKAIAKARGYKRGWAQHQQAKQRELMLAVRGLLEGSALVSEESTDALWAVIRATEAPHHVREAARAEINYRKTRAA